jgi:o-succinylbenzoate synthase
MKIIDIRTTILKAPLKTPFVTALRRVENLEDLVVIIECDDGTVGYGEGAPTPQITGETMGSMIAAIEYMKPHIVGHEVDELDIILKNIHSSIIKNTTAKSALEIALYDLKAKSERVPMYRMLGGSQTHFKTDITISMGEVDKMVADALHTVKLGYETLKIKIGNDPQKDIERIRALHAALPSHIKLRLDANQGWSAKESVTLLHTLEKQNIIAEFIEQPVAADDIEGLKYIKERVQTPLLADESIFSLKDARRLLEMQAIDYVNIKLAKTGGISQALALADLAHEFDTKCMIGCMLEGPISVAAGVHVASAKADIITMLDLDAVALLASHPVETDTLFNESEIILGEDIGLGISLKNYKPSRKKSNNWNIPYWLEKEVKERDTSCVYCGVTFTPANISKKTSASWEHIINDATIITRENIAICCASCNASKGSKQLSDWLKTPYCHEKNINYNTVAPIIKLAIENGQ